MTHSRAKMARIDLPPFQDAIDAAVPAIMVAHVTVPAYDRRPATVSKRIVTGLLRERMGFEGLVVSDSLGMQAVASRPKLAVEVVAAGVDVLLMPNDPAGAVRQVKRAAGSSRLPVQRVREAVMHVLEAKQRLGLLDEAPNYPKPPSVKQSKGWPARPPPPAQPSWEHALLLSREEPRSSDLALRQRGATGATRGRCAQRSGPGGRPSKFSGRC